MQTASPSLVVLSSRRRCCRLGTEFDAVQVEPVRVCLAGADRGGEHQGGHGLVRRQADGLRIQGQDQEHWHTLSLHLGQGLPPPRQHRRRPRQVHLQPAGRSHGAQGQGLHVPEQHLKGSAVNYIHYSTKHTDMEPRDAGQQDLHHGTRRRLTSIRQVPPHGMPSSSSRSRRPNPDPSEPRDIQTNV